MNFKKYHVSKNLIDYKTIFSQFIDSNGDISGRVSQIRKWVNFTAEDIGKTLTLSFYAKSVSASYIRVQAQINGEYVTGNNINAGSSGYSEITITPTSTDDVWRITYGNDAEIVVNQVMLEESSTRTAYEPYSSEVWHDIPYYVHNTSTDTITTLPAVLYPTGTTATVGLKGNTLQSSIPSPTSPVMPQGTGERTGNLFDKSVTALNAYPAANGTISSSPNTRTAYCVCEPNTTYTISKIASKRFIVAYTETMPAIGENYYGNITDNEATEITITTGADASYLIVFYYHASYDTLTEIEIKDSIMVVEGSTTPSSYIPNGYKIPISSAGQTTPIYLGEVKTTRKIKKLVLTGEESWQLWNGNYYSSVIDRKGAINTIVCSHFINSSSNGISYNRNDSSGLKIAAAAVPFVTSVSELATYLAQQYAAGTPVTVWYVLATETTGIVNEPLMKIGTYADEVSGITIPTITGKDTFDVLTTLKPSEVELTYTGWHDATVKESDGSDWQ